MSFLIKLPYRNKIMHQFGYMSHLMNLSHITIWHFLMDVFNTHNIQWLVVCQIHLLIISRNIVLHNFMVCSCMERCPWVHQKSIGLSTDRSNASCISLVIACITSPLFFFFWCSTVFLYVTCFPKNPTLHILLRSRIIYAIHWLRSTFILLRIFTIPLTLTFDI